MCTSPSATKASLAPSVSINPWAAKLDEIFFSFMNFIPHVIAGEPVHLNTCSPIKIRATTNIEAPEKRLTAFAARGRVPRTFLALNPTTK